ncbi:MAG TPA: C45 family autoproteolytic acyltransferase/hydrolase [Clostridiales bacterium]|nr:C45 family autoproteolytic acyltransferase/hydrolase [Clostridiales bacterium]
MGKNICISKTAVKTAAKTTAMSILSLFLVMSLTSCQSANPKSISSLAANISDEALKKAGISLIAREGKGALLEKDGQRIIVLKGTPYEMGYQHGVLLKDEVAALAKIVIEKISEIKPGELKKAWDMAEKYIPERYKEELKGLAEGAEIKLEDAQLVNMFPELFHCSGIVLFGKATKDGELLHARILDYATEQGIQNHSIVMLMQPDGYNTFFNAGMAGLIGSVTGMNDKQISVGEIGGGGEGQWEGIPMTFLMRMALEETEKLKDSVNTFKKNPRTCEYFYVISDAKIKDARVLYCTPKTFMTVKPGQNHPFLPSPPPKDALIASAKERYTEALKRVKENYGNIDKDILIEILKRPVSMKSNLHNAVFIPKDLKMWLAVADDPSKTDFQACYQTYYEYDMPLILKYYSSMVEIMK